MKTTIFWQHPSVKINWLEKYAIIDFNTYTTCRDLTEDAQMKLRKFVASYQAGNCLGETGKELQKWRPIATSHGGYIVVWREHGTEVAKKVLCSIVTRQSGECANRPKRKLQLRQIQECLANYQIDLTGIDLDEDVTMGRVLGITSDVGYSPLSGVPQREKRQKKG